MRKIVLIIILILIYLNLFPYYFGKNKVQPSKLNWSRMETLHFDIYFKTGDNEFAEIAALMAEDAYYHIKQDFKNPVKNRIPIIFYKSHQDFETTNIIYPLLNESVGGFTESAQNRVVVPFNGSYRELEEVLIHELTHAYVNEINRTRIGLFEFSVLPFWFQEGLPEFESVEGDDVYNNMFIIDLIMNDGLHDINQIGGFYAYRQGESFLVYLSEKYGRDKVIDFFYAIKISNTLNAASKKVFDLEFDELQIEWKNYLKRKYFPFISSFEVPYEAFERKTDHKKDGSYMNIAPRFSPDGENYLYFSNKNLRTDIWKGSTLDLSFPKRILKGEVSGSFEEFHFRRNNISWLPDGEHFAFVAKTSFGDKIYIMNYEKRKITDVFAFPDFDAIFEIDVSKDGKKIVFSGQQALKNDIFIFDLETKKITQITDDRYYDYEPRWSPDDKKIVFSSERNIDKKIEKDHIFDSLISNIFYYDTENEKFYNVTDNDFNNYSPLWNSSGDKIIFISEREKITNFEVIDINTAQRAKITKSLGGVFSGDLDSSDENLIFSCFYESGWDIYLKTNPLENLKYWDYKLPTEVVFQNDFYQKFEIENYSVFGKKERKFKKELPKTYGKDITTIDFGNHIEVDSSNIDYNIKLDERPQTENIPKIYPYKTKFFLDGLWGGVAYSSAGGAFGQIAFSLSDIMGNHSIGVNLGISDSFKDSDFILNYFYMARRIDYGIGGFYVNDEKIYSITYTNSEQEDYMRERDREYGFYVVTRYPFNKFWRVDLENVLYQSETQRDWWNDANDYWMEEYLPSDFSEFYDLKIKESELIYSPQINFVHDNSLYGSVGPVSGWRWSLILNQSFSDKKKSYSVGIMDFRKYMFFAKRYSLAFRLLTGGIIGETDQKFEMNYYSGVRGYDEDPEGKKKVVTSMELRFPFVDHFKIAFPLPLYFHNIRGSAFLDAGSIWDDNKDLMLVKDNILNDLKVGMGFGPRLNLGYFILKFDVAWSTDLETFSKPVYYISLMEDF